MSLQLPQRGLGGNGSSIASGLHKSFSNNGAFDVHDDPTMPKPPITSKGSSVMSNKSAATSNEGGYSAQRPPKRGRVPNSPFLRKASASGPSQSKFSSGTAVVPISEIEDVKVLEDMLQHNQALLSDASLCSLLPGGIEQVRQRQATLEARLEHLYEIQGIKVKEEELEDVVQRIKLEDMNEEDTKKLVNLGTSPSRDASDLLSSSPTSPSNGFQRSWQKHIPGHMTMSGKIGQLSLEESLALQAKESQRIQLELLNRKRREQQARVRFAAQNRGDRSDDVRELLYATVPDEELLHDEEEDYNWLEQGYYDDDTT